MAEIIWTEPALSDLDAIADYVAGMTDRFALAEHRRLTHGRGLD